METILKLLSEEMESISIMKQSKTELKKDLYFTEDIEKAENEYKKARDNFENVIFKLRAEINKF